VYGKVDGTPFSFAIVLPEPYGSFRFKGQTDLKKHKTENYTRLFDGTFWRIHPDWVLVTDEANANLMLSFRCIAITLTKYPV